MKVTRQHLRQILKEELKISGEPRDQAQKLKGVGIGTAAVGMGGAAATGATVSAPLVSNPVGATLGASALVIYLGWLMMDTGELLSKVSTKATFDALSDFTIRMMSAGLKKARLNNAVTQEEAQKIQSALIRSRGKSKTFDRGVKHIGKIIPYITKSDWTNAVMSVDSPSFMPGTQEGMINKDELETAAKILWNETLDLKKSQKLKDDGYINSVLRALGL